MRICSIASGSSGNSIYVGSEQTHLLIDCGISGKRIEAGLEQCKVDPKTLSAILITHEHSDHISGLGVLVRRYGIPVYATAGTIRAIKKTAGLGKLDKADFIEVTPGISFSIGDIDICPVTIFHDAAQPVAYRFNKDTKSIGILTDSGTFDKTIVDNMQGLDVLLLEANHDVHMLQTGSYPYYLQQRILSDHGHLSNETSGRLLNQLLSEKLKCVILGHLSKENNYPDLAYETVRVEVDMADTPYQASDFQMFVANRDTVSEIIQI